MHSKAAANALILAGSSALLGGALAFQHFGGINPCEMCLWQRWPHLAAILLGLLAWALRSNRAVVALAALATATSGAIGVFHAGVEQKWWQGFTTCSAPVATNLSDILAAPVVRCDAIAWSLFGVSMAGWNAILSLMIAGGALWLLTRKP